jgi:hypothetical protein
MAGAVGAEGAAEGGAHRSGSTESGIGSSCI